MKRKLNTDEMRLTRNNTNKNKKQIKQLKEDLEYNKQFLAFKSKWKKYNLDRRTFEEEQNLKRLDYNIKQYKSKIEMLETYSPSVILI